MASIEYDGTYSKTAKSYVDKNVQMLVHLYIRCLIKHDGDSGDICHHLFSLAFEVLAYCKPVPCTRLP